MVVATDKKYDPQERVAISPAALIEQTQPLVEKALKKLRLIPAIGEMERRSGYLQGERVMTARGAPRSREFERKPEDAAKVLEREKYKTSMTTSLKNITRRQKKDLLVTSSRLLHTGVLRGAEPKGQSAGKVLSRPASSYALVKRAERLEREETKSPVASQLKIQGARQRDIVTPKWNSYKVMPSNYTKMYTNKGNT
eukprot:TRINITY_DN15973_c0_g1_i11.p3 TRINITY_DN15973_c0_g1~~TRINITY_DN15973_c0_g1_i11.p3  ORF type:complete len:197 (+),score=62.21 TRINITY_DN15973_c0_g1_i11:363-953(+)